MFTFISYLLVFVLGFVLGGEGVMRYLAKRYHCTKIPFR